MSLVRLHSLPVGPAAAFCALVAVAAAGCGARDALSLDVPDAANPGEIVSVDCGGDTSFTAPRQPLTLRATASSESPIVESGWRFIDGPGEVTLEPAVGESTRFTADVAGTHRVRFRAVNADGLAAECDVTVEVVVGPPVAICPDGEFRTPVGSNVLLTGSGFDDDAVVAFQWDVVSSVPGAMPVLAPRTEPVTQFESDRSGEYLLRLTVYDREGTSDDCVVPVTVTSRHSVMCPVGPILAPTRRSVVIEATIMDDGSVVRERWEVLSAPETSRAAPSPSSNRRTNLTPDRVGDYRLRFTAEDEDGFTDSCEVTVVGTETPPTLTCPAVIETTPLTPTRVVGTVVDDGQVRSANWTLVESPPGSDASPPRPANNLSTVFTPDIAGDFVLRLAIQDDSGNPATCTTVVRALATEGLRIEMFWNTNGTDMDLHLLHPDAVRWNGPLDCFYGNCVGGLAWSAPSNDDDPSLDLDDVNGFGPENINIERPEEGTYRLGVHSFRGDAAVTVRIYCGGSTTEPRATIGPFRLSRSDLLWRVADITIARDTCTIDRIGTVSGYRDADEPR